MGYAYPDTAVYSDLDWLDAEAELSSDSPGSYSAVQALSVLTGELASFREQIAALVEGLSGRAVLATAEGQVGCSITLKGGSGEVSGFVRQLAEGLELRVDDKRTDQSYLQQSLRELDAIVNTFPQRGGFQY